MACTNKQFTHFSIFLLALMAITGCSSARHTSDSRPTFPLPADSATIEAEKDNQTHNTVTQTYRRIILKKTLQSIGTPYRWGGTSPSTGFDCSGLVVYTHATVGITPPRTVKAMFHSARPVKQNLRPGDLVFFRSSGEKDNMHVGIFIGGDTFVHAPGKGKKVRKASLKTPYFSRHFIRAGSFL